MIWTSARAVETKTDGAGASVTSSNPRSLGDVQAAFFRFAGSRARPESVALCRSAPGRLLGRAAVSWLRDGSGPAPLCFPPPGLSEPVPTEPAPGPQSLLRGGRSPAPRLPFGCAPFDFAQGEQGKRSEWGEAEQSRSPGVGGGSPGQRRPRCLRSRVRTRLLGPPHREPGSGRSCLRSPEPRASLAVHHTPSARAPSLALRPPAVPLRIARQGAQ